MSALWGPGNALHHVLVFPQLGFALFGSHHPHAHSLVIGAAGDERAVLVGPHHADPLPVAREGLHAVAGAHHTSHGLPKQENLELVDLCSFKKSPYPVATSHIFMVLSLEAETM